MKPLAPLFEIVKEHTRAIDLMLGYLPRQPIRTEEHFDAVILHRGVNAMKAAFLLSEEAYWELGSAGPRQLFELVLNMEEINRAESRLDAMTKFLWYGYAQNVRQRLDDAKWMEGLEGASEVYDIKEMEDFLALPQFDQFKDPAKGNRPPTWHTSWCNKKVWDLAKESKDPSRIRQYKTLFTYWSGEVHASPGALRDPLNAVATPDWMAASVENDIRRVAELLIAGLLLLQQLWVVCVTLPQPTEEQIGDWNDRMTKFVSERFGWLPPDLAAAVD